MIGNIYIMCPANLQSGGPEALHQICYYLNKIGKHAYMVYLGQKKGIDPRPVRYAIYNTQQVTSNDIIGTCDHHVLVPEYTSKVLNGYTKCQRRILVEC